MSVYSKENPNNFDRALKSNLSEQTLMPSELVLVCDGPLTAELDEIIEKYRNMFPDILKVYPLEENIGLGNALNFGLKKCSYDLVARSDSDDVCVPERFALQTEYMKLHPEVSASSGAIDEFDDDPAKPKKIKIMPITHNELCEYARKRNPLNHMAVIFRKSDVIEVGSYQHLKYLEDYYLWMRLVASGKKIGNLDKILVHACVGNGMLNRRADKIQIEGLKVLGKFMMKNNLQSFWGYFMCISRMTVWCNIPNRLRILIYNRILRK